MKLTSPQTRWISDGIKSAALLGLLLAGGCAAPDARNASTLPWNRQTRWEVSKSWIWVNDPSNDDWNRSGLSRTYP